MRETKTRSMEEKSWEWVKRINKPSFVVIPHVLQNAQLDHGYIKLQEYVKCKFFVWIIQNGTFTADKRQTLISVPIHRQNVMPNCLLPAGANKDLPLCGQFSTVSIEKQAPFSTFSVQLLVPNTVRM